MRQKFKISASETNVTADKLNRINVVIENLIRCQSNQFDYGLKNWM